MTTLRIHSTPLIYSPGMFRWLEHMANTAKPAPGTDVLCFEIMAAMGIPDDFHLATLAGEYVSRTEGETLVITYDVM
jgi:hypothetical protein